MRPQSRIGQFRPPRESGVSFDDIVAIYTATLAANGPNAAGVHWESADDQAARFERIIPLLEGSFSINDFGCGYGALYDHIAWRLPLARYVGTDATPAMIACARRRIPDPRATFRCATSLADIADYTVASGLFAFPGANARASWRAWTFEALRQMWDHSRRGIAFNVLHVEAMEMGAEFYGADAGGYAAWCTAHLAADVEVVTPAGAIDSTFLVRRPA